MASQVEICNLALGMTGGKNSIAAITESSKEAFQCNLAWNTVRDTVLRDRRWQFADKFQVLADLGTPPTGWDYRYAYPSDCIRAIEIARERTADPVAFKIALSADGNSKVILTDQEDAELVFTARIENPEVFPGDFVLMFATLLASHICLPLSGDLKLRNNLYNSYRVSLAVAAEHDANEAYESVVRDVEWITARN